MQRDAAEARLAGGGLRCESCLELALRFRQDLPRDVHGGRKPMRQRKAGQQRERPVRGAQPFLSPAHRCEAKMMAPVVGLEDHGAAGGGAPVEVVAGAIEHQCERRPRFAGLRVEPAGFARVLRGTRQRRLVWRRIRARRLELHDARVGEADVTGRVLRRAAHDGLEDLARPRDLTTFEALQRGTPFDKRAERRQQRVERRIALARRLTRDAGREAIAATGNGFDEHGAVGLRAEQFAQA